MSMIQRAVRVAAAAGAAAIRAARATSVIEQSGGGSVGASAIRPPDPTLVCKVSRALRRRAAASNRALYPLGLNETARSASAAYPTASLHVPWGFPVEVNLLGELPLGAGNALFAEATVRQAQHPSYEDEHNEESARIGATTIHDGSGGTGDLSGARGDDGGARASTNAADVPGWHDREGTAALSDRVQDDVTALYTFSVGGRGHPFHRHEGHRCFTAISGSSGCRLAFSPATPEQVEADPGAFVEQLQFVDVPPDGLFTVRFNGGVWHRFSSLRPPDPAFFAISVHTDETGGKLDAATAAAVAANESSIGLLTQRLPAAVEEAIAVPGALDRVPISLLVLEQYYPRAMLRQLLRSTATVAMVTAVLGALMLVSRGHTGVTAATEEALAIASGSAAVDAKVANTGGSASDDKDKNDEAVEAAYASIQDIKSGTAAGAAAAAAGAANLMAQLPLEMQEIMFGDRGWHPLSPVPQWVRSNFSEFMVIIGRFLELTVLMIGLRWFMALGKNKLAPIMFWTEAYREYWMRQVAYIRLFWIESSKETQLLLEQRAKELADAHDALARTEDVLRTDPTDATRRTRGRSSTPRSRSGSSVGGQGSEPAGPGTPSISDLASGLGAGPGSLASSAAGSR